MKNEKYMEYSHAASGYIFLCNLYFGSIRLQLGHSFVEIVSISVYIDKKERGESQ